jgi:hypothetical protein
MSLARACNDPVLKERYEELALDFAQRYFHPCPGLEHDQISDDRPPFPAALVGMMCGVAEGQRLRENSSNPFTGNASAGFQPWSPSTVVPGNGGRHARDDKATAKNRYCIFGSLFDRHRNRRNRYMDSPKT